MPQAQTLIRCKATLHTVDRHGVERIERHTAWTPGEAATKAYRRAVSMLRSGEVVAYTTRHHGEVIGVH